MMTDDERRALRERHPELAVLEDVLAALEALPTPGARARALLQVTLQFAPDAFTDQQLMRLVQAAKQP